MTRRDDSLIGQIVAANVVLVALTLFAASLAAGLDLTIGDQRWSFLILALAIVLTLCVNLWMLQRRFAPLERLIKRIESIDPAEPATHQLGDSDPVEEIDRLSTSFNRLLERIEEERRRSGTLAMRAQEEERRRLARDLHDEVNQALTAILLRLEALCEDSPPDRVDEVAELKRLVNQAMEELLSLARQLRPTSLDDHGLIAAIEGQLKRFSARTGIEVRVSNEGEPETLTEDQQTVIYRVVQEALSNTVATLAPRRCRSTWRCTRSASSCASATTARASTPPRSPRRQQRWRRRARSQRHGRGARLAGGELDIRSAPGGGTT